MRTIVWFRGKDLRITDHEPLVTAAKEGEVIPLFVLDPYFFAPERAQTMPNRIHFLLESLRELAGAIEALGSRLVVTEGKAVDLIPQLSDAWKVDRVRAHRWSEPVGIERDARILEALGDRFVLHEGETLARPGQVVKKDGGSFAVFTPFSNAFKKAVDIGTPLRAPRSLPPLPRLSPSPHAKIPTAKDLGLEVSPEVIEPGENAAKKRLAHFLKGEARRYEIGRNELGHDATSRMSQDLKFGTLSARTVYRQAESALEHHPRARLIYLNELIWREFAHDVLRTTPTVLAKPFKKAWNGFPWRKSEKDWQAWVDGTTGYGVVDAAARELLATGFVHNRARMISASFLTKHLLINFRRGEDHYLKWLTDGDWANNDLGWQWTAGCGVDASPWFRIFNPIAQSEKFDPERKYVHRWVPEARGKPLHEPYKEPVVDHVFARKRFLAAAKGHL